MAGLSAQKNDPIERAVGEQHSVIASASDHLINQRLQQLGHIHSSGVQATAGGRSS